MTRSTAFSQREFRDALGGFPTGVAVACARAPVGHDVGVTVNSFTSVSLAPPLIAINLAASLRSLGDFLECGTFAVNLLRSDQGQVARIFGQSSNEKWSSVDCRRGLDGCPIIEPNLAVFECRRFAAFEAGDHMILVGKVERFSASAPADPLVFFQGDYCRLGAFEDETAGT